MLCAGIYYSDPKGRPKQSIRQLDVEICITGKISVQAKQPTNVRWLLVQAISGRAISHSRHRFDYDVLMWHEGWHRLKISP